MGFAVAKHPIEALCTIKRQQHAHIQPSAFTVVAHAAPATCSEQGCGQLHVTFVALQVHAAHEAKERRSVSSSHQGHLYTARYSTHTARSRVLASYGQRTFCL